MRFTDMLGSQADPVEYHLLKPQYAPADRGAGKVNANALIHDAFGIWRCSIALAGLSQRWACMTSDVSVVNISRPRFRACLTGGGICMKCEIPGPMRSFAIACRITR